MRVNVPNDGERPHKRSSAFRSKTQAEAVEYDDLHISPQPKQMEVLRAVMDGTATWIGYGGALGGGKSETMRQIQLIRRQGIPGSVGLIFRKTYKALLDNHINPLFARFPTLRQYYAVGDMSLTLPRTGGSKILFGHADNDRDFDKFMGPEYYDICIDQAEQISEKQLLQLKSRVRSPGSPLGACKFILAFNPGGQANAFLKRIFLDRKYRDHENAQDYCMIQARGWDNVEWVRAELATRGLSVQQYYGELTDDQRRELFLQSSSYGHYLASLPQALKLAYLEGSFGKFEGQYFQNFDPAIHVIPAYTIQPEPWHLRWIALDWGFQHNAVAYWGVGDGKNVTVYREMVRRQIGERALAEEICSLSEGEKIEAVYVSPDANQKRGLSESVMNQLGQVLRRNGLPLPTNAANDRIGGWRLLHNMLSAGELRISDNCVRLIETLPLMSHDPDRPEDCVKFDCNDAGEGGDDACLDGSTLIATPAGQIPIREIVPGMLVETPNGPRRVIWAGITAADAAIKRLETTAGSLFGTGSHRIFTNGEFLPLDSLRYGDRLEIWNQNSGLTAGNTRSSTVIGEHADGFFIEMFGKKLTGLFRKVSRFITETITASTMTLGILSVSAYGNTPNFIRGTESYRPGLSHWLLYGTAARQGLHGTVPMLPIPISESGVIPSFASNAQSRQRSGGRDRVSVPITASRNGVGALALTILKRVASSVTRPSGRANIPIRNTAPVFVLRTADAGRAPVYNLEVEDAHCFYANGILVHNCDAVRYLLYSRFGVRSKTFEEKRQQELAPLRHDINALAMRDRLIAMRKRPMTRTQRWAR